MSTIQQLSARIQAAQGKILSDIIIRNTKYLDVFSCQWKKGDVAIFDGVIVGIEPGLKARRTINAKGRALVPGFIDAHVHIESSLMTPWNFDSTVLPCGTTTVICDPHELANVMGVSGIQYFLDAAMCTHIDLRVMLSSCVPATKFETNGGGVISATELRPFLSHPKALGLAEVMNVPGVLNADLEVLDKLDAFAGRPIDGHCPLLRGQQLSAYAVAGISSCHETSYLEEAKEKISKGLAVWIREGSVAKDLNALAPVLNLGTSMSVGFCTDDRNPLDIITEGHIDHLIRNAIHLGVPAEVAYRAASHSVARHYGLAWKGAVAPGYIADLVLLDDVRSCAIGKVFRAGRLVSELDFGGVPGTFVGATGQTLPYFSNSIRAAVPAAEALLGPSGRVHVMGVTHGSLRTSRHIKNHDAEGVARISVLERHGNSMPPSNAYVMGFGGAVGHGRLCGAIASSVGHDSHNLIVVGDTVENMRTALAALIESGGGFCVVSKGRVAAQLALPLGGLMSPESPKTIAKSLIKLRSASLAIGCKLPEPFLQLAFLSLPVIPSLKITDKGLVDVEQFKIIDVRA